MPRKPTPKTQKQLVIENEDLSARLDDAEETLRAISSGEVDALVVPGVGGEQLFTLKGADRSYRALIEDMSEGALTLTMDGVILYANRHFAEMLKTPLEKVIGSAVHTWIAPDSQQILHSLLKKGVDAKRREQLAFTASDGMLVPVSLSVSNLLINGMPDSFCLVATDLTEQKREARELLAASNQSRLALLSIIEDQKQAEKSLRKSEERYRAVTQTANDAIIVADSVGNIVSWNCGAENLFGYTEIEIRGGPITLLLPARYHERHLAGMARVQTGGEKHVIGKTVEMEGLRKDGSEFPLELSLSDWQVTNEKFYSAIIRDITERKLVEEEKARLFAIIEESPDFIGVADLQGNLLYHNPAGKKMVGVPGDADISHLKIRDMHPGWAAKLVEEEGIPTTLREGSWRSENVLLHRNGSEIPVSQVLVIHRDSSGEPKFISTIMRDITERKIAEKQLLLQAKALEAAANAIVITDADGTIVWVNPAFNDVTGYELDEVLGKNPRILKSGEMDAAFYQTLWGTILSGKAWQGEMINRRKDGTTYFEEQTITPVMDEAGEITNFIAIKQDVTARKQEEEATSRLAAILEATPDLVSITDLEGQGVYLNRAGRTMLGIDDVADLTRHNLREFYDADNAHVVLTEGIPIAIRDGAWRGETELLALDGHTIAVSQVILAHKMPNGTVKYLSTIAHDITERKTLAEQLRQSQKLEAIGLLAGGIAHDFNNLLTVISGYSDLTLKRLSEEDPLHRYISEVKMAAERAAGLTRQLLAFSRKQVLQPKVLDLNSVVSELEKMLRRLIGEDIGLRTVLESGLGSVKADPGQIEQIIMNLAVNARDAMPQGGTLTIETKNVYLDKDYARNHVAVIPGPYVMLAVSDSGSGMTEQTQARIFEPFFTTKETGKGTGLGLSTVYGIVKQSAGNIWVYSEVGRGTTFKIYLPRVDEGAQEYKRSAETETALQGAETILLAEDEEMVRKLAGQVLEMYGYRVLEAANGGAALLICERHKEPIHLLITDVIMPEMSGRELADRLAQIRPEMKVLYMSGYTDNAIVHQGVLDEGANFIQKPFPTDALARKVRDVLDAPKKFL